MSKTKQCLMMTVGVTFSKTGLLLFTSSTPTTTWAVEDNAWGPPEALSSVAVTLRTYSTPWSRGGGLERKRIKPAAKQKEWHWLARSVSCLSYESQYLPSIRSTFKLDMKRIHPHIEVSFSSALKPKVVSVCVYAKASACVWKGLG